MDNLGIFRVLSQRISISSIVKKDIMRLRKITWERCIASEFTKECFSFNTIAIEDAFKEINVLDTSKAIQAIDIPVKVIKGNSIFFAEKICPYFNESIGKEKFPNRLKLANITPAFTHFKK